MFVREIYAFSINYQTTASNLTKLLAIFASNGAWFPSNPTRLPKRHEGTAHVPHETIRHKTSQSQKTSSTQSPRPPQATTCSGPALYRGHPSGPQRLGFSRDVEGLMDGLDRVLGLSTLLLEAVLGFESTTVSGFGLFGGGSFHGGHGEFLRIGCV